MTGADGTRTLVVHLGGIGDFLLVCPTLPALGEGGTVELVGRRERLNLAVAGNLARAVHDADAVDLHTLFSEPSERLRSFLARFERVVAWVRDEGGVESALRGCGITDVQVFPGLPPEDWTRHATEYYLDSLGLAAVPPLCLAIPPGETPYDVVIHPGSGGQRKNWPTGLFFELADALEVRGRCVTWCLGPAEEELRLPNGASVLREHSLAALAGELAAARVYVGNDSGVTHLAAAAGCSTIAIFGPTEPRIWAPRGDHVTVVQGSPWPRVQDVIDVVLQSGLTSHSSSQSTQEEKH